MNDQKPLEPGQEDTALPSELVPLDAYLLAEGQRWRQREAPTGGLERHVRALVQAGRPERRSEGVTLADRSLPDQAPDPRPTPRHRPPSRWRGPLELVATVLLVVMAASVFAFLRSESTGGASNPLSKRATPTRSIVRATAQRPRDLKLSLASGEYFQGVSFSSALDGWAVGGVNNPRQANGSTVTAHAVLVHYHNGAWLPPVDAFPNISLDDVSMVSAADGWAVGQVDDIQADAYSGTVLLHYTGDGSGGVSSGHWRAVSAPALVNLYPQTIRMFSPDSGYITGVIGSPWTGAANMEGQRLAVAVYQNGVWKLIATPFAVVDKVVMASAAEGWAVDDTTGGGPGDPPTTLYHYLNGVWTKSLSLPMYFGSMGSISLGSAADVWVLGSSWSPASAPDPAYKPVIYHYNGSVWTRVSAPGLASIPSAALTRQAVFADAASGVVWLTVATLSVGGASNLRTRTSMMWVNRGGGWLRASLPASVVSVFALAADGAGGTWAIAQESNTSYGRDVLYTQGTDWTLYGRG